MSQDSLDNSFDDDFDQSCGLKGTTCTCWDCIVYFNNDTNRPIKSKDITDKEFEELSKICSDEQTIELMKKERYRANIYEIVPYPLWKKLQNKETYNAIVEQLKTEGVIPDEEPEICHIGSSIQVGLDGKETEIKSIAYRFPTSTVKYELIVEKSTENDGKVFLKTHGRGSEIKN